MSNVLGKETTAGKRRFLSIHRKKAKMRDAANVSTDKKLDNSWLQISIDGKKINKRERFVGLAHYDTNTEDGEACFMIKTYRADESCDAKSCFEAIMR